MFTPPISRIHRRPARRSKSRTFREVPRSRFRPSQFIPERDGAVVTLAPGLSTSLRDLRSQGDASGCSGAAKWEPSHSPPLARFRPCVPFSEGGFSSVRHLDPLRVRRGLGLVVVVPVPPLVRRVLGVPLWRDLPSLLTAERRNVEVAQVVPIA